MSNKIAYPALGPSIPFLGKGLFAPLRMNSDTGDFYAVDSENNVRQCVRDLVFTSAGERPMREKLGTIANDLTFEDEGVLTDLLKTSIQEAVERYEPRIILTGVTVTKKPTSGLHAFEVRVKYILRATNKADNFVFPFFLD